jgi:hypothetical protein
MSLSGNLHNCRWKQTEFPKFFTEQAKTVDSGQKSHVHCNARIIHRTFQKLTYCEAISWRVWITTAHHTVSVSQPANKRTSVAQWQWPLMKFSGQTERQRVATINNPVYSHRVRQHVCRLFTVRRSELSERSRNAYNYCSPLKLTSPSSYQRKDTEV